MCTACNWGSSILHFSLPLLFFPLPSLHHITMYILYNYYKQDEAALRRAALSGDVAAVKRLVNSKVNINCTDEVSNITVSIHFICKCVFYRALTSKIISRAIGPYIKMTKGP